MISTDQSVSPPVSLTQVGSIDVPVAPLSKRAAVSHSVPALGPPVVTMTKNEPSGEKSTPRMYESKAPLLQ